MNAITRRSALQAAAGLALPFTRRLHAAAPGESLTHASFGASGMAGSDIGSLTASKHVNLVAVAEVDQTRLAEVTKRFPNVRVYDDWRKLLDKEKSLDSVNVSTPDHMHAPIAMSAIQRGLHVYCQKPLTQTIYEARQLTRAAAEKNIISQMGIQIHGSEVHRTVVRLIQDGAIGLVREVHSWSGKDWGDSKPRPKRVDPIPATLQWDLWLGVAADRPFLNGYYHPGVWRKRRDFGTGTFGDMGCHILDPVFNSLALTAPTTIRSDGGVPNSDSWALGAQVRYQFLGTKTTTDQFALTWYDGSRRPPNQITDLIAPKKLDEQGSIYVGQKGVLYSPYIAMPSLFPKEKLRDFEMPKPGSENHYLQFVESCRGNGKTSTPFSYSGPLTETVLLGCLSTRFFQRTLTWDAVQMNFADAADADVFVRKAYRKGWEVAGL